MAETKKVKIAYSMRPVETVDAEGNKTITYEKYHPVTTGNAVVVSNGGKKEVLNKALSDMIRASVVTSIPYDGSVDGAQVAKLRQELEQEILARIQSDNAKADKASLDALAQQVSYYSIVKTI